MKATLFVIQDDADHAQAKALIGFGQQSIPVIRRAAAFEHELHASQGISRYHKIRSLSYTERFSSRNAAG